MISPPPYLAPIGSFPLRLPAVASLLSLIALALSLTGCGESSEPLNPGKVTAFVSVPPQSTVVSAIGGEHVVVEILAGEGQDPHDYSPSPKQAVTLGRAEVWFTTRMPFEKSMQKKVRSNAKRLKISDTAAGIPLFPPSQPGHDEGDHHDHSHDDHDHGHDHHDHDHSSGDPHLWLSPPHLKTQAQLIAASLSEIAPQHSEAFQSNLKSFEAEVDNLHAELQKKLEPYRGATFLAYHGAFGWFAESYGLTQEVIEFSGKSPETRRLRSIIEEAKKNGIRVVFTQPQYDINSAKTVAEGLGGKTVSVDPLSGDLLENLRNIADLLIEALSAAEIGKQAPAVNSPAPQSNE